MLRPGESGSLAFADGRLSGHVEWLQSDRFTLRCTAPPRDEVAHDCSFVLRMAEGRCEGRGRFASTRPTSSGTSLVTIAVLDLVLGAEVYAASLHRQLANPTAVREEFDARAAAGPPAQRPHPERHHWENEERFRRSR